jgi:hypothetical protein
MLKGGFSTSYEGAGIGEVIKAIERILGGGALMENVTQPIIVTQGIV